MPNYSPAVVAELVAKDLAFEVKFAASAQQETIGYMRDRALRALANNCEDYGYAEAALVARTTASALAARELELHDLAMDIAEAHRDELTRRLATCPECERRDHGYGIAHTRTCSRHR